MRIAIIDRDKCIKEKCGYQCIQYCPGVRMGDETIIKDQETGYPVISETLCTGCGICVKKCPANAIKIINLVSEEDKKPFHQYGPNMFRIYGLPLPSNKGVTGIIGKNGIGKSTALNILSGNLIPNFGEYEKHWDWDMVMQRLSVVEQNYFKDTAAGRSTVAYKIQYVDLVAEKYGEKRVSEIIDDDSLIEEFELEHVLDRKLSELSGGELQRLVIAVVFSKDADLYFFDEPTSYLDILQRIKIARKIKELSERKSQQESQSMNESQPKSKSKSKKVMVVEHDLAILDYLSDYVYVFYGAENAYGVVSHIKSARSGINEFLNGYLKDENMRFRGNSIRFEDYSRTAQTATRVPLVEYPGMVKNFDKFKLSIDDGVLNKGEVVGIIGQNAIGKTLFMKMLAGVVKPDNTELKTELKIAYKPQYIKYKEDRLVSDVLMNPYDKLVFEECKKRLSLAPLMTRRLSELSGGELQRVSITAALIKDADVYLFDEPSAFLDIEQRLHFIGLLRRIISNGDKSAFVVDHDVVLIDGVSDRLMVFDGKSSVYGHGIKPMTKRDGMNRFLSSVGVTMRRDRETYRPRINKLGSALDREQKEKGEYYYSY